MRIASTSILIAHLASVHAAPIPVLGGLLAGVGAGVGTTVAGVGAGLGGAITGLTSGLASGVVGLTSGLGAGVNGLLGGLPGGLIPGPRLLPPAALAVPF